MSTNLGPVPHPPWCDRAECRIETVQGDLVAVNHSTRAREFTYSQPETPLSKIRCRVWLMASDDYTGGVITNTTEPLPCVAVDGETDVPFERMREFGRWLVTVADELEAMTGTEGSR